MDRSDSSPSMSSKLSGFEIQKKLGQGAQGVVFKVRRKQDNLVYVLKQISTVNMHAKQRRDCVNEAVLLHQLNSPYIVRYFDSFVEANNLNIIMEYCEQGDLETFIKNQMGRPLTEVRIWRFFFQIAEGLLELHSKSILHRDIKSMNIFLTFNDSIRIGDLGVAKQLEPNKSHAHAQVGTPYYMSPEILQDIPYNEKSDVWSLGCVLYQLATFKRPFEAPNGMSLAFKIQKAQYVPLSNIYSPALHRLIENCLTKDHLKRKSIAELLEDPEVDLKSRQVGHKSAGLRKSSSVAISLTTPSKTSEYQLRERIGGGGGGGGSVVSVSRLRESDNDLSTMDIQASIFATSQQQFRREKGSSSFTAALEKAKLKDLQINVLDRLNSTPKFEQLLMQQHSDKSSSPYIQLGKQQQQLNEHHRDILRRTPSSMILSKSSSKFILQPLSLNQIPGDLQQHPQPHRSTSPQPSTNPMRVSAPSFNHMKSTKSQINYGVDSPALKIEKRERSLAKNESSGRLSPLKNNAYYTRGGVGGFIGKDSSGKVLLISQNHEMTPQRVNASMSSSTNTSAVLMPTIRTMFQRGVGRSTNAAAEEPSPKNTVIDFRLQNIFAKQPPQVNRSKHKHTASTAPSSTNIITSSSAIIEEDVDLQPVLQKTSNPQLKKLFKNRFDYQVQMNSLVKTCVTALGQPHFKDTLEVFRRLSNSEQEIKKYEHDEILFTIDEILKNKREYAKHFYQIIQLESQLVEILDHISRIELQQLVSK